MRSGFTRFTYKVRPFQVTVHHICMWGHFPAPLHFSVGSDVCVCPYTKLGIQYPILWPLLIPIPNTNSDTGRDIINSVHLQAITSLTENINIMKSRSYDSSESVIELLLCETSTTFTTQYCQTELLGNDAVLYTHRSDTTALVWCLSHSKFQVPLTGLSKSQEKCTTAQYQHYPIPASIAQYPIVVSFEP